VLIISAALGLAAKGVKSDH